MLGNYDVDQPFYFLQNLRNKAAGNTGICVYQVEQNNQQYVIKFLTQKASQQTQKRFQHELRMYQELSLHSFCSEFNVIDQHALLFIQDQNMMSVDSSVLLLPYYQVLTQPYLIQLSSLGKLKIFRNICIELAKLHQLGYVNADLKLTHLAVVNDSIRFLDLDLFDLKSFTEDGLSSTPAYMAPELFHGEIATIQSDIYAVGIIFYEMLMDRKPYSAKTYQNWASAHCQQDIPLLDHPYEKYQNLLDGMLAKLKHNRFKHLEAIKQAVNALFYEN